MNSAPVQPPARRAWLGLAGGLLLAVGAWTLPVNLNSIPPALLTASVGVFEGRPAWLTTALDLALSIATPPAVRRVRRGKVCVDLDEAIAWLAHRFDPVACAEIRARVADLRAALPPIE